MSIIRVYDIASGTWKTQKATSTDVDFPRRRREFCAVAMSAQDHSSHQIYFYGGIPSWSENYLTGGLDDLWVLTLPSFQFVKVGNSAEASRSSGTCAVISPEYLLAYRGLMENQNASLALLDLTDLEWKTEYTPVNTSTVYRVPQRVIEVIGGEYVLLVSTMVRTVCSYHLVQPGMQQSLPQQAVSTMNSLAGSSTFQILRGLLYPLLHPQQHRGIEW